MTRIFAALAALALLVGCDNAETAAAQGSVTVKLPPPRPAVSAPGFSFREPRKVRG